MQWALKASMEAILLTHIGDNLYSPLPDPTQKSAGGFVYICVTSILGIRYISAHPETEITWA